MPLQGPHGAIAGLGITTMSRTWMGNSVVLAAKAIQLALEDAGLEKDELDGLLVNSGVAGMGAPSGESLSLNLQLMNHMNGAGSTAGQMVQYASLAIQAGLCNVVACVF